MMEHTTVHSSTRSESGSLSRSFPPSRVDECDNSAHPPLQTALGVVARAVEVAFSGLFDCTPILRQQDLS